jgi:glycosyltransferase involved in cell wall biosynthesis
MFAGNVGEAQDMPAILDAAEAAGDLEGLRWLIVGDGRAMEGLKADIERRQLADRVHLLGRHAVERMPAFFAGADTLLVSLRPEPIFSMTIPGKVQSYLATGRPVLGMINGEGARVIRESGGGLAVPAGDGAGLAAAVRELMAMTPAARAAMGQNGRDYAAQHFGREALFDQLEGWFGEVRSRGPAPAE